MRCIEPQESTAETKYWIGSLKACLYVSINVDLHIILFRLGSNNIFGLAQTAVDGANRYQRPFGVGQTKRSNFKLDNLETADYSWRRPLRVKVTTS
jgi:hypothetical protein